MPTVPPDVWGVIPAAGRGTRLGDAAGGGPKPLVEVGGRPILDWLIERLTGPVTDVCVVVAEDEGTGIRDSLGGCMHGVRVSYAVQPEPRGVGDAILRAAGTVRGSFVTVMGDCWYDAPLEPHIEAWKASGTAGGVLVEPADGGGSDPVGLVRLDGGRVRSIEKSRPTPTLGWRVAGLAVLPEAALALDPAPEPGTGEVELEQLVTACMERGAEFTALPYEGWRRNINHADDVAAVEERIAAAGTMPVGRLDWRSGEGSR